MPKLSVIVPVYNVELYLRQCLESILNQTLRDIEVICVNDGSPDKSAEIILDIIRKDHRVRLINKENGGLASARNKGLESAKGEYIAFLDSDDWLYSNEIYSDLISRIEGAKVDIIIGNVCKYYQDKNLFKIENFKFKNKNERVVTTKDLNPFDMVRRPCNKIYRHGFLKDNKITFPEDIVFDEGAPFTLLCMLTAETVYIYDRPIFNYRIILKSGSSITKSISDTKVQSAIEVNSKRLPQIISSKAGSRKSYLMSQNLRKLIERLDMVLHKSQNPSALYKEFRNSILCYPHIFFLFPLLPLRSMRLLIKIVLHTNIEGFRKEKHHASLI